MSDSPPASAEAWRHLNEKIKAVAGHDWCHRFELDDTGQVSADKKILHRWTALQNLFGSLFKNRRVLIFNESSGLYPIMIRRAGAASVAANNSSRRACELIAEFAALAGEQVEVLPQSLLAFDKGQILVDFELASSSDFLFAQGAIWSLHNAAGRSFADVVEGCSHYVTEGLVFDWTDARWAKPAPPEDYRRENFHAALFERYEYVLSWNDWLTVAAGKLPVDVSAPAG